MGSDLLVFGETQGDRLRHNRPDDGTIEEEEDWESALRGFARGLSAINYKIAFQDFLHQLETEVKHYSRSQPTPQAHL